MCKRLHYFCSFYFEVINFVWILYDLVNRHLHWKWILPNQWKILLGARVKISNVRFTPWRNVR